MYDENGDVMGFYWNGEPYVYAKNLQGDVIGIIDKSGVWAVQYEYDAWGKLLSATGTKVVILGILNPFRYRSYNYDVEHVADMVISDVENMGRTIRRIESSNAPVSQNEYRIALQTGPEDYHFSMGFFSL